MTSQTIIAGCATPEGTRRFANRFPAFPESAFREHNGLQASSLGIGTYLGEPEEHREQYQNAINAGFESGINVLDTAINYRHQASERDIGAAFRRAISNGTIQRDEIIVSTKGGFLPLDFERMDNPRKYLSDEYLNPGIIEPDEIVGGCQCLAPDYIGDQFERSLHNLGFEAIDIYLLHNVEMQLQEIPQQQVYKRVKSAFEVLARKCREGKLTAYGVATWEGLRQPANSGEALSLEKLRTCAIEAEGHEHHFRAIQLPVNFVMSEALRIEHDPEHYPGKTVLEIAGELGLFVMTSASIMQGQLARGLPSQLARLFPGCETDAQRALQHTRCAPGVTTALVGMKTTTHVKSNANLLSIPCLSPDYIAKMYKK